MWNTPALLTICRIFVLLAVSELTGVCRWRRFIPKPYTLPVGRRNYPCYMLLAVTVGRYQSHIKVKKDKTKFDLDSFFFCIFPFLLFDVYDKGFDDTTPSRTMGKLMITGCSIRHTGCSIWLTGCSVRLTQWIHTMPFKVTLLMSRHV